MKTFAILAVVIVALFAVVQTARAANATTNLHIEGMTCAGCKTAVKMVLKTTPGVVSIVALLSPTCGICQKGQRVVQSVFSKHPDDARLRGFVVWLPMLPSDSKGSAGAQAASFVDERLIQHWDGDRASGNLLAKTLGLTGAAWDVYLLYATGVKWTGEQPPAPAFWMHQLREESGADQRACLNPAVFESKVAELLRATKGGA